MIQTCEHKSNAKDYLDKQINITSVQNDKSEKIHCANTPEATKISAKRQSARKTYRCRCHHGKTKTL